MTVTEYEALPWTIHGRAVRETPKDAPYYLVTIEELEGFSVVAATRAEAEALLPVVLREYLAAAVESGYTPPVPAARS
jgi:predicted RNase H-like HicB family nuclease